MKVSFVLLAHEPPEQLRPLIESVLETGCDLWVHYDAKSEHNLEIISQSWELADLPGQIYFVERVSVVWGEWSIIQATLNCLYAARERGYQADFLMLLSGSCMPAKPIAYLTQYLSEHNSDHIEAVNANQYRWVTDGIQQERWEHYHWVNWRYQEFLFRLSNKLQNTLGVKREPPLGHTPFMGSQWWCLRSTTIDLMLSLIDDNPVLIDFYRRTWIPDELFFQTLVANLVPHEQIAKTPLTRYRFNSSGTPRIYYDDSLPELLGDPKFFARKISRRATSLRQTLKSIGAMSTREYGVYCAERYDVFRKSIVESDEVDRLSRSQMWRSIAAAPDHPADFCKAIPKSLTVVCSVDREAKQRLIKKLKENSSIKVFGDLLCADQIDFGPGINECIGYQRQKPALAHHRWHFFLGDILTLASAPICVFTLGYEAPKYLEALRWNYGLQVVLFSSHGMPCSPQANQGIHELYRYSQQQRDEHELQTRVMQVLSERHCELYVKDADDEAGIIDLITRGGSRGI